ncbi:MAG: ABC transporter permease [Methanomassiliicoccus sp.]|nr:ABC transporter permease [Methanomassiliicoccus sp.]
MINPRAISQGFVQQALTFLADPQWIIPSIVAPFTFTMVTLMIYPEKSGLVVLYAILGGGILGMWGNMIRSSGFSITYDRVIGTLEPLMMTPTPIINIVAGRALWNTFIGLLNAGLIFILAILAFNVEVSLSDPVLFFLSLVITLLSLGAIGVLLSALFVLTRASGTLVQIIELPVFVISGALIPISELPEWTWPLSMILPPTWSVDALQVSSGLMSGNPVGLGVVGDLIVASILGACYMLVAIALFSRLDSKARASGQLGMW